MISSVGMSGTNQAMMQRSGSKPPPPPPEEKFAELDTDSNGSLNTDELQVMASELSEMFGSEISVEDLLEKLDADGSGTLDKTEMPPPKQGHAQGPPPFLDADGNLQDTSNMVTEFNPMDSLLSYLDSGQQELDSESALNLIA